MGGREPQRNEPAVIGWVGSDDAVEIQALSLDGDVVCFDSVADALEARTPQMRGICVATSYRLAAFASAHLNDGLAKAVGFADTLGFAGGLPGAFGFAARTGGIVASLRRVAGRRYFDGVDGIVLGSGPEAAAALAALTQLKTARLTAYVPPRDAATGAVAHRLGIDLHTAAIADWSGDFSGQLVYDARVEKCYYDGEEVDPLADTLAAQLKALTSREFDFAEVASAISR